jgi:hypothetical protein
MSTKTEADPRQGHEVEAANASCHSQIVITVKPDARQGRYHVYVETAWERPFLDGACKLLASGHDPERCCSCDGPEALSGPLGVAANPTGERLDAINQTPRDHIVLTVEQCDTAARWPVYTPRLAHFAHFAPARNRRAQQVLRQKRNGAALEAVVRRPFTRHKMISG